MHKYGLAVIFVVLFQSFTFAQSPKGGGGGGLSVDFGFPIDLWSANSAAGDKLKYNDVSFSFGFSGKYFWSNNFGIFGNLDGTRLLQREFELRGVKTKTAFRSLKTNVGLSLSIGPAYRIPLGASAGLYIGVGPSYTLQVLGAEDSVSIRGISFTRKITRSFHMLGVAVDPGIIVNFGRNLVFDAGVGLGFNFLRLESLEVEIGGISRTADDPSKQYFGVTISPHIGIGYSL